MQHVSRHSFAEYLYIIDIDDLVRIGGKHDGGYIVPKSCVLRSDALISCGLGSNWEFELQFRILNKNAVIYCYDHTVSERTILCNSIVTFLRLIATRASFADFIGSVNMMREWKKLDRIANCFQRRVVTRKNTALDVSVDEMFSQAGDRRHIFLKMDIEGCEYGALLQVLKYADVLDCIVVEFHDTEALRLTFESVISKVRAHFDIVHIHGNNYTGVGEDGLPESLEITFLAKRFAQDRRVREKTYLSNLDAPCNRRREEVFFDLESHVLS
ncbi:FkbM family methyltransferase [Methylosinus sp. Ce-a6]|uniref:FkbM family methyltransferase n=1 Tax=Methylosinus sp. Ce-a6 TaxID=2172005 RepID=UPI00135744EF|nr:FkbM family methyltransferase [Methylosinus sp. Ce-a6]